MFGQTKYDFSRESGGLPNFIFNKSIKHNTLWGMDYLVFLDCDLEEIEIDSLIDALIFLKVTE